MSHRHPIVINVVAFIIWAVIVFTLVFGYENRAGRFAGSGPDRAVPCAPIEVDSSRMPMMIPIELPNSDAEFEGLLHMGEPVLECKARARVDNNLAWDAYFLMLYPLALAAIMVALWSAKRATPISNIVLLLGVATCVATGVFDFRENSGIAANLKALGQTLDFAAMKLDSRMKWVMLGLACNWIALLQALAREHPGRANGFESGRVCAGVSAAVFGLLGCFHARGLFAQEMNCVSAIMLLSAIDFSRPFIARLWPRH